MKLLGQLTPFELVFGCEPRSRVPEDAMFPAPANSVPDPTPRLRGYVSVHVLRDRYPELMRVCDCTQIRSRSIRKSSII